MLFDQDYYIEINEARWRAAEQILAGLEPLGLRTCLDLGCGPGWFSQRLAARGLEVTGIEGRSSLFEAARERCPAANFCHIDVESAAIDAVPAADLVFCFGLLYHLENPFAFVRRLHALTGRALLLETIVAPGDEPTARLVEEGRNDTQGLTHCCLIPTKPALVKMLSIAGFGGVYEWNGAVDHPDFKEDASRMKRRSILVGLPLPMPLDPALAPLPVPPAPKITFARQG